MNTMQRRGNRSVSGRLKSIAPGQDLREKATLIKRSIRDLYNREID